MRTILKSVAMLSVCGMMSITSACKSSGESVALFPPGGPIPVPLTFSPSDDLDNHISLPTGSPKIFIKPVSDDRTDKSFIGHNNEDTPIAVVATGATPDVFVHDAMAAEFKKIGITQADTADAADRNILVSLKTFTADEGGTYKAEILTVVQVTDNTGKVLYNKSASGDSSHWGRSKVPANYDLVLSNAVVNMTSDVLSAPDFAAALSLPATPGKP